MEASADLTDPPPAGQTLAVERERQGLSRVEMAQRLHMSPLQVEALETGDYSRLPKGPFLRGFVRNYAKALGLDAEALLARLEQESPRQTAPRIVVPSQNIRFDPLGERLQNPYVKAAGLALVAIALGFAAMYWWLFIKPTPPAAHKPAAGQAATAPEAGQAATAPEAASPAATPPQSAASVAPPQAAPAKSEPTKAEATKAQPAKAEAPKPAEAPKTTPAAARGEAVLRFHFNDESWVEVRDAKAKVVFQQLNPADSDATVTGTLPLRVIVGNAPGVSLRYNDRDFPLEPHTKVAVARFTLE